MKILRANMCWLYLLVLILFAVVVIFKQNVHSTGEINSNEITLLHRSADLFYSTINFLNAFYFFR